MKKKQKIIFICTGNSCRSQMAEGIMRKLAPDNFEIYSAGISPNKVHPNAIEVMKEMNIDISNHTSDSIDCYTNIGIDMVITVCDQAKQNCPVFPKTKKQLHWNIEDPFDGWSKNKKKLNKFRRVRDIINNKILKLIDSMEK